MPSPYGAEDLALTLNGGRELGFSGVVSALVNPNLTPSVPAGLLVVGLGAWEAGALMVGVKPKEFGLGSAAVLLGVDKEFGLLSDEALLLTDRAAKGLASEDRAAKGLGVVSEPALPLADRGAKGFGLGSAGVLLGVDQDF